MDMLLENASIVEFWSMNSIATHGTKNGASEPSSLFMLTERLNCLILPTTPSQPLGPCHGRVLLPPPNRSYQREHRNVLD
jgi:hypothetical protein